MGRLTPGSFLTVIMDVFVVLAVAESLRVVVRFFGALATQGWGQLIIMFTDYITVPFSIAAIKTPYGGVFDAEAALTVGLLLLIEWVLSIVRSRG